jgi:hypothetical protein
MLFALVLALAAGSVHGVAVSDGTPLPGCTVSLISSAGKSTTITDIDGRYWFASVMPGRYDLLFELEGLEPVERSIQVVAGVNEQRFADLRVAMVEETITLSCNSPPCQEGSPQSVWDEPSCSDYLLDEALIASIDRGDRSALELLRSRYTRAATWAEKHLIAEGLLRKVPDDSEYWDDLFEHARNVVRFRWDDGYSDEFLQWCEERQYNPYGYDTMAFGAFTIVSTDPRSRALLLEAIERNDSSLVFGGILGLAEQRDLSALPAIERVLQRIRESGDESSNMAQALEPYRHEDADQLAFRYLNEYQREEYLQFRDVEREQ